MREDGVPEEVVAAWAALTARRSARVIATGEGSPGLTDAGVGDSGVRLSTAFLTPSLIASRRSFAAVSGSIRGSNPAVVGVPGPTVRS